MELPPDQPNLILHTERTTISGDRYLIFYTFTTPEEAEIEQEEEQADV
jgi:hypothetical protein